MWFAECFFRALGKEALCQVLNKKHSTKKTLGKDILRRVPKKHSAKQLFKAYFEALNEFKLKSF
jgi:hypothetical protein